MNAERLFQKIDAYRKAVTRLKEAVRAPDSDLKHDAVIQRFKFCFELGWKVLKLYLAGIGFEANSPSEVFRMSLSQNIILDGNGWTRMQKCRNLTSHTYDEEIANEVYEYIESTCLNLLENLESELSARIKGNSET